MLYNLITTLTGIDYDFPPIFKDSKTSNANTLSKKQKSLKDGSTFDADFDDVSFFYLRKNAENYVEADDEKDVVVCVGKWRLLVFIDNGAGSGLGDALGCTKANSSRIGNMTIVRAAGDGLYNQLIELCKKPKPAPIPDPPEPVIVDSEKPRSNPAPKAPSVEEIIAMMRAKDSAEESTKTNSDGNDSEPAKSGERRRRRRSRS